MAEPNNTEMIEMWQTGKLSPAIFTYFHKTRKVTVHLGAVIVAKGRENERWQDIKTILEEKVLKKGG